MDLRVRDGGIPTIDFAEGMLLGDSGWGYSLAPATAQAGRLSGFPHPAASKHHRRRVTSPGRVIHGDAAIRADVLATAPGVSVKGMSSIEYSVTGGPGVLTLVEGASARAPGQGRCGSASPASWSAPVYFTGIRRS